MEGGNPPPCLYSNLAEINQSKLHSRGDIFGLILTAGNDSLWNLDASAIEANAIENIHRRESVKGSNGAVG